MKGEIVFTGIIEEVGKIINISTVSGMKRLEVACKTIVEAVKIGDSIAVDGVCLTVVKFNSQSFDVEVMKETLEKTTLNQVKPNQNVNLERALSFAGRLSGHFVTGHIDGIGNIQEKDSQKEQTEMTITYPEELAPYLIPKGSIAVDGISLTIGRLQKNSFTVYLIPHTLKVTTIGEKNIGDRVNLEADIIGKYIHRYLTISGQDKSESRITSEFLKEHGII